MILKYCKIFYIAFLFAFAIKLKFYQKFLSNIMLIGVIIQNCFPQGLSINGDIYSEVLEPDVINTELYHTKKTL